MNFDVNVNLMCYIDDPNCSIDELLVLLEEVLNESCGSFDIKIRRLEDA